MKLMFILAVVVCTLWALGRFAEQDRIERATPETVARWRRVADAYRSNALAARREYDIAGEEVCERLARQWDERADKAEAMLRGE